jgi:Spy/CpxP family protein refolding chaperone
MPFPRLGPRGRAALVLLLVAAVALLAGVALDRSVLRASPRAEEPARWDRPPPDAGSHGQARFLEQLSDELGLDSEQRRRVDSLLTTQRERMHEVQAACRPKMKEVLAETRAGMAEVLTPQQQGRLERIREERGWGRGGYGRGPR